MSELFGLPTSTMMLILLVAPALCGAGVAGILVRGRVMFRMGVRNLGRRRSQSVLVVALMGIGCGVLGAVVLSRNLMSSEDFAGTSGLSLYVPWPEIILFAVLAFAFALLMTWWPSRRAASVPIAEALRYE